MVAHYVNNHKEEISKFDTINCRVAAKKGGLLALPMFIEKEKKRMECCLGCKTFYNNHARANNHRENCRKKEEHKKACMALLPTVENTTEESSEAVEALKAEIVKLRRALEKKDAELKDYETMDCSVQIVQSVLGSMPKMIQKEVYDRCISAEKTKKAKIDDWNMTEWDEWFDSDIIDGYLEEDEEDEGNNQREELPYSDEE